MRERRNRNESGFTILEVMIAMAILAMGFLAVASAQIYALQRTAKSKHLTRALHLAQEQMEAFSSMPIASLPATGNDPTNPIDPDPNDNDQVTFLRTWVVEPNTPSTGITRLTVNVGWVDENGIVRNTSLQSLKAF